MKIAKGIVRLILALILFVSMFSAPVSSVEPTVTTQVRAAIEDFLVQYPTIFMESIPTTGNWSGEEDGQFRWWEEINGQWQEIVSYEAPSIYFSHVTWGYYDINGNRFSDDTPWLARGHHAFGFQLFDLDNNGIPYILISSSTGHHEFYGFHPYTLYRYFNGEYRRVYGGASLLHASGWLAETSFFPYRDFYFDPDGNLVGWAWTTSLPGMGGREGLFAHIDFNNHFANNKCVSSRIDKRGCGV